MKTMKNNVIFILLLVCKNEKTMKAVIEFCNQRDYYKFAEYYKGCVLFEREMKIQPIYG